MKIITWIWYELSSSSLIKSRKSLFFRHCSYDRRHKSQAQARVVVGINWTHKLCFVISDDDNLNCLSWIGTQLFIRVDGFHAKKKYFDGMRRNRSFHDTKKYSFNEYSTTWKWHGCLIGTWNEEKFPLLRNEGTSIYSPKGNYLMWR